jgi:hypothetical protein
LKSTYRYYEFTRKPEYYLTIVQRGLLETRSTKTSVKPATPRQRDTRYINEKLLPPYKEIKSNTGKAVTDTAIQEYWARKGIESEVLGQMARDFIAIPATSAPSERVFSSGGDKIIAGDIKMGDLLTGLGHT